MDIREISYTCWVVLWSKLSGLSNTMFKVYFDFYWRGSDPCQGCVVGYKKGDLGEWWHVMSCAELSPITDRWIWMLSMEIGKNLNILIPNYYILFHNLLLDDLILFNFILYYHLWYGVVSRLKWRDSKLMGVFWF